MYYTTKEPVTSLEFNKVSIHKYMKDYIQI